jgi:hypothetical protein
LKRKQGFAGLPPRRPVFDPGSVHVGFVMDKVALGQVFPIVLRFSPANFIPPVLNYLEKRKKNYDLHHTVAQEALRLRYVRSICCGALHHKKKRKKRALNILGIDAEEIIIVSHIYKSKV